MTDSINFVEVEAMEIGATYPEYVMNTFGGRLIQAKAEFLFNRGLITERELSLFNVRDIDKKIEKLFDDHPDKNSVQLPKYSTFI